MYRYRLASNKFPKLNCPYCGAKKHWQRYFDEVKNELLPDRYGRCDNESKCGKRVKPPAETKAFFIEVETIEDYSAKAYKITQNKKPFFIPKAVVLDMLSNGLYIPEYFFQDAENEKPKYNAYDVKFFDKQGNNTVIPEKALNQAKKPKEKYFVPTEVLQETLTQYDKNKFINNLLKTVSFPFDAEYIEKVISLYYLGTSINGATSFPFIDVKGNIRAIQEKVFDKTNHTDKTLKYHTTWIHSRLRATVYKNKALPQWLVDYDKNETKVSCLLGEHLLTEYPRKDIALVEAPKTAIYGTLYFGLPQQKESPFLWLAVYNLSSLTFDRCKVLKGRNVVLFPDLSKDGKAFDLWSKRALEFNKKLNGTKFIVSDLLELKATEAEKQQGFDLADYLIKFDYKAFAIPGPPQPSPTVQPLVEAKVFEQPEPVYYFSKPEQPKPESWEQDIAELETYFESIKLPTQPVKLNRCSTITDCSLFIESHFATVKANNRNRTFLPYLNRLQELKQVLTTNLN